MKNKGFTLVELLGAIIILGVIAMIVVPNVNKSLKEHKKNLCKVQYENILIAAKAYGADRLGQLNDGDIITLKDLQDNGYIDEKITNPQKSNQIISNSLRIVVVKDGNKISYQFKDKIACLENKGYTVTNRYVSDSITFMYDISNSPYVSGSNFILKDLSGNGNDGTLSGFSTTLSDWYSDNGIVFDGVDDTLKVEDNNITGNFTAHMIFKISDNNNIIPLIVQRYDYNDGLFLFSFGTTSESGASSDHLNKIHLDTNGSASRVNTNYELIVDKIYVMDLVVSDTTANLYINNNLIASSSNVPISTGRSYLTIFSEIMSDGETNYLANGNLYNVIFYNKALTEEEVKQNYQVDASRFNID